MANARINELWDKLQAELLTECKKGFTREEHGWIQLDDDGVFSLMTFSASISYTNKELERIAYGTRLERLDAQANELESSLDKVRKEIKKEKDNENN